MRAWWTELDNVLRGRATSLPMLASGRVGIRVGPMVVLLTVLGAVYGVCMGLFGAVNRPDGAEYMQMVASAVKVPLLFLLTLVVTFPSLYVFNALVGSRLDVVTLVKLLVASIAVTMAVLASLGPVVAFFTLSTETYSFMLLLNVAVFTVSGVLGMSFLLQTMNRLTLVQEPPRPPSRPEVTVVRGGEGEESAAGETDERGSAFERAEEATIEIGALEQMDGQALRRHVKAVFQVWSVVFGVVGGQMAWILRPFVGSPRLPFEWFRAREGNFIEGVLSAFRGLFS